ncbi:MAG: radical SAM protein, partial [Candidatus Thermoplasmatota archaeon]|nr:radical SAM protein [Candidatus Thermoplasmatota archaeon]
KFLSRVVWPEFDLDDVLGKIDDKAKRVCIQMLKYPKLADDLVYVVEKIRKTSDISVSACVNPLNKKILKRLKDAGLDRVGLGLDCASEKIFKKMKPSFKWNDYIKFLNDVTDVFGSGSAHLIAGLGETDEDIIKMFQKIVDINCYPALFAFTPVKGINIDYPQPGIERYRAIQLARYLIVNNMARYEDMVFENGKLRSINISSSIVEDVLKTGKPFQTSGCPDCNRPFYNERPGGVMYNYPYPLKKDEMKNVKDELKRYLRI